MSTEDEDSLKSCLEVYKEQLDQVESSLTFVNDETSEAVDLQQLRDDLKQLIQLTEQSLVSLKKSKLLSMLSEQSTVNTPNCTANDQSGKNDGQSFSSFSKDASISKGSNNPSTSARNMDDEFDAFQLALQSEFSSNENRQNPTEIYLKESCNKQLDSESECSNQSEDSSDNKNVSKDDSFDEMSGKKCRVSYSHSWGELTDHNAMIIHTERSDDKQTSPNMARVVFLNPTHRSMQTCPYFLDDKCRFSDEDCRYSHGTVVSLSDLKLFKEPDFSSVCIGCRCLALDVDGIWYPATVVDVLTDNKYHVQFDITLLLRFVDLHDILPIDDNDAEPDSDTSDSEQPKKIIEIIDSESDEDDVKIVPFQEKPNGASMATLGQWEKHTRGIGSKLMARMGYISGQGLGKYGEGRSEPVPAEVLPKGKSLDKIMELRSKDCGRSLNSGVINKRQQSKQLLKASLPSKLKTLPKSSSASVFDFLNSKLGVAGISKCKSSDCLIVEKGDLTSVKNISVNDLKSKSDRDINIELFKTQEEIQSARNSIRKLQESLRRTEQQDPTAAKKIRSKLTSMQQYVTQMETSVNYMQQHADNRKAHKILVKF